MLAAAESALGHLDEGRRVVAQCRVRWPALRLGNIMPIYVPILARDADRHRLWDALRQVGFPE